MELLRAVATSLVAFVDMATQLQSFDGDAVNSQVAPEFVDIIRGSFEGAATKIFPSAEQATPSHQKFGTAFENQVAPESVEL
jgi:hypothetical protein